jgi:hypothetical protein
MNFIFFNKKVRHCIYSFNYYDIIYNYELLKKNIDDMIKYSKDVNLIGIQITSKNINIISDLYHATVFYKCNNKQKYYNDHLEQVIDFNFIKYFE